MNILGLHFGHDASAAVIINGEVSSYVLKERITGVKHHLGLFDDYINLALDHAELAMEQVDYCTITSSQRVEIIQQQVDTFIISLQELASHNLPCAILEAVTYADCLKGINQKAFILDLLYSKSDSSLKEVFPDVNKHPRRLSENRII